MDQIHVEIPESLYAAAGKLARASGITLDQLVASALAEKVSALAGPEWLAEQAARGDRTSFEAALKKIADVESEKRDRF